VVGIRQLGRSGGECVSVCGVGVEAERAFGALGGVGEGMWWWWKRRGVRSWFESA